MTISNLYPTTNPSLLLDFANVKGLDPRVSFTRNSPATYWDSTGVLRTARANQPRFDHDPVTLESRGLLVEKESTNLLLRSEAFDNAVFWNYQLNTTVSANAAASPDGATSADKIVESAADGLHYRGTTASVFIIGVPNTVSVYAKAAERNSLSIFFDNDSNLGASFDLTAGAVLQRQSANIAASIVSVGNGWFRCTCTFAPTKANPYLIFRIGSSGNFSYVGDGTSGLFLWGAQLEQGTVATSYIATQSTSITRAADVPVMSGTNFTRWYEASEGTLVVQSATPNWGIATNVSVDDGTTNNQILVNWDGISSPTATVNRNGSSQVQLQNAYTTGDPDVTLVTTINNSSVGLAFNGVDVGTTTSNTLPTVNQMRIGVDTPQAWFKRIMFYRQAQDGTKIRALSSSANVALDFEPISLFKTGEPGVWFDPADVANLDWRRNLLEYTEGFDNSYWTKQNITISTNSVLAPDNTLTADSYVLTSGDSVRELKRTLSLSNLTNYVFSVYLKDGGDGSGWYELTHSSTGSLPRSWYNIRTGSKGSGSGTITSVGNGWYRCVFPFTTGSSASSSIIYVSARSGNGGSSSESGTGGVGSYVWGAQLELGSTVTEYQPIPSDLNTTLRTRFPNVTLFTDTAGTAPVKTPGESVALMLDKSRQLALGPELVAPINFTSGWSTTGAAVTYDSATTYTAAGTANVFRSYFTIGSWYRLDISSTFTNSVILYNSNTGLNPIGTLVSGQTHTFYFNAVATQLNIRPGSAGTVTINSISVREHPGYHATQATAASRPIYSVMPITGVRNLFTYSEQFSNARWTLREIILTSDAQMAPDGTLTADKIVETTANFEHAILGGNLSSSIAATSTCTVSFYAKAAERYKVCVTYPTTGDAAVAWDLSTGTQLGALAGTAISASIQSAGNGWYRCSMTYTRPGSGSTSHNFHIMPNSATSSGGRTYVGDGTSGLYIWGAQVEYGATTTAYQRVGSQYDVTESGVTSLHYLSFDGTDDFMVTSTITPNTNKVQVFAGVRKLQQAAVGIIAEHSTSLDSNNGSWTLTDRNAALYAAQSKGTSPSGIVYSSGTYTPQITSLLTMTTDIAGDVARIRVNGTGDAVATADQGTGNYLAYPLYIGRRGGTTLPFNGHLYGLIVRFGSNLNTPTIQRTEAILGTKCGFNWNNLISTTVYDRSDTAILDRAGNTIMERT